MAGRDSGRVLALEPPVHKRSQQRGLATSLAPHHHRAHHLQRLQLLARLTIANPHRVRRGRVLATAKAEHVKVPQTRVDVQSSQHVPLREPALHGHLPPRVRHRRLREQRPERVQQTAARSILPRARGCLAAVLIRDRGAERAALGRAIEAADAEDAADFLAPQAHVVVAELREHVAQELLAPRVELEHLPPAPGRQLPTMLIDPQPQVTVIAKHLQHPPVALRLVPLDEHLVQDHKPRHGDPVGALVHGGGVLLLQHLAQSSQVGRGEHHLEAHGLEVEQLLLGQHMVVVSVKQTEDALQSQQEAAGDRLLPNVVQRSHGEQNELDDEEEELPYVVVVQRGALDAGLHRVMLVQQRKHALRQLCRCCIHRVSATQSSVVSLVANHDDGLVCHPDDRLDPASKSLERFRRAIFVYGDHHVRRGRHFQAGSALRGVGVCVEEHHGDVLGRHVRRGAHGWHRSSRQLAELARHDAVDDGGLANAGISNESNANPVAGHAVGCA
mmetsp:Transcript_15507/g.49510  ORF Transcript_15507/g.49510 Transcript_15507/m.49510 type:complete len:501 (+) Transcript_15507:812-2314(+)